MQALNDFIIFSAVAAASLSAGYLQFHFGWRAVNVGVLPLLALMFISLLTLGYWRSKQAVISTEAQM